jgi:hypothetical protein
MMSHVTIRKNPKIVFRPSIHPVVASCIRAANIPIAKIFLNDLASVRDENTIFFPSVHLSDVLTSKSNHHHCFCGWVFDIWIYISIYVYI